MKQLKYLLALAVIISLFSHVASATVIKIPADQPTIQQGLNFALAGDTVLVQPGTYVENVVWPAVNGIKLFSAGDTSNTVIDGDSTGSVISFLGVGGIDTTTVVRGFRITNGGNVQYGGGIYCCNSSPILTNVTVIENMVMDPQGKGGGIYCDLSSPTLTDVTVSENVAANGGGMYCSDSSPTLTNVTVSGNSATDMGGGGIYCDHSSPTLTDVTVSGNSNLMYGGGIYCCNSNPSLTNVTVSGNSVYADGGGIYCHGSSPTLTNVTISGNSCHHGDGAGIFCDLSSPTLTDVIMSGNSTPHGGGAGIYCWASNPILIDVTVSGNFGSGIGCSYSSPTLTNVTVSGNSAYADGGGIYCQDSSPTLTNVTVNGNEAVLGGGICCWGNCSPTLTDVIVSGNLATLEGGGICGWGSLTLMNVTISENSARCGGGIFWGWGSATLTNVTVSENTARSGSGGGIELEYLSNAVLMNVTVNGNSARFGGGMYYSNCNPALTNVTVSGNSVTYGGGGIHCSWFCSPTLTNVTVSGNSSCGIYCEDRSNLTLENTIIAFSIQGEAIHCEHDASVTLTCCDVYGNAGGDWVGCIAGQDTINGNFSEDPLFCDPVNQDFTLHRDSPCAPANNPECGLIGAWPVGCGAAVYVVQPDGLGDLPTIQAAIDTSIDGDTIELTNGTFTGTGNRDIDYLGKAVTVRSQSENPDSCIIDCEGFGRGFYFCSTEGAESVLEGIKIINGANVPFGAGICCSTSSPTLTNISISGNQADQLGGGIYCIGSSPILTDVTVSGNLARVGGGINCDGSSPTLTNVSVSGNGADSLGGGMHCFHSKPILTDVTVSGNSALAGGGICCLDSSSPSLTNVTMSGNEAGLGGGMYCANFSNPTFTNVTVHRNGADSSGGGMYCLNSSPILTDVTVRRNEAVSEGGGVCCSGSSPSFTNVAVDSNIALAGGGICCLDSSSPSLTNVTMSGNEADLGGGMYCADSSSPTLTNVTVHRNEATLGGGMYSAGSCPTLENTIIAFGTGGEAVYCTDGGSATLSCCDIYNNDVGDWIGCIADQYGFNGNICEDPLFCGEKNPEEPYTLQSNSPCAPENNPGCGLIGAWPVGCEPTVFVLNADGTGDFATIQAAIDSASAGDIIELTDGVFTGDGNRDIDYQGKAITMRSQSGNPDLCIIDCQASAADPHCGVYFHSGEGTNSALEGVSIVNGYAGDGTLMCRQENDPPNLTSGSFSKNPMSRAGGGTYRDNSTLSFKNVSVSGSDAQRGGGIHCSNSSPSLIKLIVSGSDAECGGGIYCSNSSASLRDVTVHGNEADWGGGMYFANSSSPTLTNVTVCSNVADWGGGMYCVASSPDISNCTITDNDASDEGDGLYATEGSWPDISHSNICRNGTGVYNNDPSQVLSSSDNWWGDETGPYHPDLNPGGLGDTVNAFVDPLPFLTETDTTAPPLPPVGLVALEVGADYATIAWRSSPIGDLAGYRIYFDSDSSGFPYADTVDAGLDTVCTLSALSPWTTYYIAVTCYDNCEEQSWYSKEIEVRTDDLSPPEAIGDLTIVLAGGDIRLWWTEPCDDVGVIYYVVYRDTMAISLGDSIAGTVDTTYTDVGVAGDVGTNYFYAVKAVDAAGNKSEESNRVGEFGRSLNTAE